MTDCDPAAGGPPVPPDTPGEPWPSADMSQLLYDFGYELVITPEIRGDHLEITARPRFVPEVASARTPRELRAQLEAMGYVPWT